MMKRNILAVIVPALLVAGTANAAEIYNKDGNKVDLYGKAVGLHYFSKGNGENSYGGNGDMTYARLGFKGETQINSDLTGYGQWEYNFQGNNSEGADAQTGNKTRLAFAGLKYADVGSFDYGRNYGVVYDWENAAAIFARVSSPPLIVSFCTLETPRRDNIARSSTVSISIPPSWLICAKSPKRCNVASAKTISPLSTLSKLLFPAPLSPTRPIRS